MRTVIVCLFHFQFKNQLTSSKKSRMRKLFTNDTNVYPPPSLSRQRDWARAFCHVASLLGVRTKQTVCWNWHDIARWRDRGFAALKKFVRIGFWIDFLWITGPFRAPCFILFHYFGMTCSSLIAYRFVIGFLIDVGNPPCSNTYVWLKENNISIKPRFRIYKTNRRLLGPF